MLHYAILYYDMLCYAMQCYDMICYAMLCYAMLFHFINVTLHYISFPMVEVDLKWVKRQLSLIVKTE